MSFTLMLCRLRGLAELRRRIGSSSHPLHRTFAQSTKSSRRPVARSTLRRPSASPSPSPFSSPPPRNPTPTATEEHRESSSSSRTVRQPTPVSVKTLAASRRAAFDPQSQTDLSEDSALTPTENAAAILNILSTLDRALPLRQLERLIHTLLTLATASHIPALTPQQYLTALRALTRRELSVGRHLPHYTKLAASIPPTASPYHPAYNDTQLMARLVTDSDRLRLRRAFALLAFGVRVDMAVQLLALVQPGRSLPVAVLCVAERVLELAGHRYMAARVRKAVGRAEAGGGGVVELPGVSELGVDVRRAFSGLLSSSDATRAMTASATQRLAAELEQLSAGKLGEDQHLQLLLASVRIGLELTAHEVEQLSDMLPLASQKLEINRESQEDSIVRWRVMELAAAIIEHMKQQRIQPTELIHDELFRVYANCAAIEPALDLLTSLRSTDPLHYRYLLRTASLLNRYEQPHTHALNLLHSLPQTTTPPDTALYNDVLRACDRAEQYELLFHTAAEMRAAGVEGNEVTWQYVAGAGMQCGEEGRGVVEVVGRGEEGRAEWRAEVEAEMEVVEQMGVADFVAGVAGGGGLDGGDVKEEEVGEEVKVELRLVKDKLKAELAEEMKLVDDEASTPVAVAPPAGTVHSDTRAV